MIEANQRDKEREPTQDLEAKQRYEERETTRQTRARLASRVEAGRFA